MAQFQVVGFKTEYRGDKAVDWVEVAPIGEAFDRTRTWHRIKDITPPKDADTASPSHVDMLGRWDVIRPQYEAWKSGEEIPDDGTPLAAWPGVSADQAAYLRQLGIRTVEAVAVMKDSALERLHFANARRLPGLAQDYLKGRDAAHKDAEMAELKEQIANMQAMLTEHAEPEEVRRGPGRPRKDAV